MTSENEPPRTCWLVDKQTYVSRAGRRTVNTWPMTTRSKLVMVVDGKLSRFAWMIDPPLAPNRSIYRVTEHSHVYVRGNAALLANLESVLGQVVAHDAV
jgi:hypothetical protein